MFPKEIKAETETHACPCLNGIIYNSQIWKQPKYPQRDKWINKMWYIHGPGSYSALRRKEILTHAATWMNLEDISLREMSGTKGQMLYDSTATRYWAQSNSERQKVERWMPGAGEGGMLNYCLMLMEFQLGLQKMKMFWRWMVAMVCKNVNIWMNIINITYEHNVTELYT